MPDSWLRKTGEYKPQSCIEDAMLFQYPHFSFPSAIDYAAQKQFSWLLIRPNKHESNVVIEVN